MLGSYALSSGYYDAYYSKAQKVRTLIIEDFKRAFEKVDLIVGPTMPSIAYKIGAKEDLYGELTDTMQTPGSMAGLCVIAIPGGFSEGMPVGIQIIGEQLAETKVMGAAYAFQEVTDFHKKFPEL
ncbi:MAG: aspartyl/glutamyl-tRNA amidotransferase subunit A [uncultured bacterium]|nr:MAG: aspartyl/glutamyl-tRNA amidotransferase subunit A [uncultured bacterium]